MEFTYGHAEMGRKKDMAKGVSILAAGFVMSLGIFYVPLPGTDMPLFLQNTLFFALMIALNLYSLRASARSVQYYKQEEVDALL